MTTHTPVEILTFRWKLMLILWAMFHLVAPRDAAAENLAARALRIKDSAETAKKDFQLLINDPNISASDGYAYPDRVMYVSLVALSQSTGQVLSTDFGCDPTLSERVQCWSSDTSYFKVQPGKLKLRLRGEEQDFELDTLANQLPIVVNLRFSNGLDYCAVCDSSGTDDTSADGTDGKLVKVKNCDPTPCPIVGTATCCEVGDDFCFGGDDFTCYSNGGNIVGAGAVCDAGTAKCVAPPTSPAGCCEYVGQGNYCVAPPPLANSCPENAGDVGTFVGSSVCSPSGSCEP